MSYYKIKREPAWLHVTAIAIVVVLVCGVPLVGWVGKSYFEAKAYERVTGKHVSTWDALWLELRVQEPPK